MSDYNFLMENRLTPPQFEVLNYLSRFAHSEGLNLYLVGGAVRDLTCGRQVRDLDFAVEGNPAKVLRHLPVAKRSGPSTHSFLFSDAERAPAEVGEMDTDRRMNSVQIRFSSGVRAELTQCRQERYSRPGRPPEIISATIFDDLKRRDFAMNAMAVSLHPNSRGLLLDPTNGVGDIERQEIRTLHGRGFVDDPSRIFRAIRLGARLGFKPDERTRSSLDAAIEARAWNDLTAEQQERELEAILLEDNPASILKILVDRRLLAGLDRSLKRVPYERFHKIRLLLQKISEADPLPLNFDCLTSTMKPTQKKQLAGKVFRFPSELKLAVTLEHESKKLARVLSGSKAAAPSQAYRLLVGQPQCRVLYLLAYYSQAKIQTRVKTFLFKAPHVRARAPRLELQSLGVPLGPKFEKILAQIFFDQLDGKIRTAPQLTKALYAATGVKEPQPKPPVPKRTVATLKKLATQHVRASERHNQPAAKQEKKQIKPSAKRKKRV